MVAGFSSMELALLSAAHCQAENDDVWAECEKENPNVWTVVDTEPHTLIEKTQDDCNHDYEFKISQFKNMQWWNYYTCRKCGKGLKVYSSNLQPTRS